MSRIINYIKKRLNPMPQKTTLPDSGGAPKSWKSRDGLIGLWKTEDTGGIHMISGQALEFKENGEGIYYAWANTDPEPFEHQEKIIWKWVDEKTILIKSDLPDAQWEEIYYEIKSHIDNYNRHFKRLTSPNFKSDQYFKEGFWKVLYPLVQSVDIADSNIH